jgi:hypothetical protein
MRLDEEYGLESAIAMGKHPERMRARVRLLRLAAGVERRLRHPPAAGLDEAALQ